VTFNARAMLLPHDWRDRTGTAHVWVRIADTGGQQNEAWTGTLPASDSGRPRGHHIALPEGIPLHLHHGSPAAAAPPAVYNFMRRWATCVRSFLDLALIDYCVRATETG
jgi:hypothetical protein